MQLKVCRFGTSHSAWITAVSEFSLFGKQGMAILNDLGKPAFVYMLTIANPWFVMHLGTLSMIQPEAY